MNALTARRQVLKLAALGATASISPWTNIARAQGASVHSVKALVFDTFGTVVDWRGSIAAEFTTWAKSKAISVDWATFADRWRAGYGPSMNKVRRGEMPWTNLDH